MDYEVTIRRLPYEVYKHMIKVATDEKMHAGHLIRQLILEWYASEHDPNDLFDLKKKKPHDP